MQQPVLPMADNDQQGGSRACARAGRRTTASAEGYLNRYRNGWGAASGAARFLLDETVRRRGKPVGGVPAMPLAELPLPVPISRFAWPIVRAPTLFSCNS